jgi:hypothetical protein
MFLIADAQFLALQHPLFSIYVLLFTESKKQTSGRKRTESKKQTRKDTAARDQEK